MFEEDEIGAAALRDDLVLMVSDDGRLRGGEIRQQGDRWWVKHPDFEEPQIATSRGGAYVKPRS